MLDDIICAPATPPINSAIAIIRISGPGSAGIAGSIFNNSKNIEPRAALFGSIIDINDNNRLIDDVILIYYKAPVSFTGEDMIEIFCHGNQGIVHRIIDLLSSLGVRMAEPGEFTQRAFLNGKMDLTAAEAIHHVITARSEWEIDTALKQMHGSLRQLIYAIREDIILLKADIEAGIDFIEEDIEFVSNEEALQISEKIRSSIDDLLRRCKIGEKISQGINVTICGKPNVGKSSILNLILNQERAIVSDIPGTTRDLIRESVQIHGMQINLTDTAGIHTPDNEIEKIGIELSHKNIETASIVLMIIDAVSGISDEDRAIIDEISGKKALFILNKIDLVDNAPAFELDHEVIPFSAKTGEGLKELHDTISSILDHEFVDYENSFVADIRVVDLLEKAFADIQNAIELLSNNEPAEIIAFELQSLLDDLAEITGEITPDDVLGSIFSRFCIGK
ncbi:MAG: tRNA uridine-5-carboxymethylaminomethyl(34) synthesis GTPase MnmE [bacterium]|nr:tRNA uridine-5-carboxymethylaminomethyl(34) synthesis GTPase MnmE [bacterium]